MTRFRAVSFGRALAPWRATRELAEGDAIDAGEATREPDYGGVFLSPGLVIEKDDGEAPMTPEQERWAEALAVIRMHGPLAEKHVEERIDSLSNDPDGVARWKAIGRLIKAERGAARRPH